MRIIAENCIALIIDYQEKLMPVMHEREALVKRSEILINGLKALAVPMMVTQQYTKGIGMTVPEVLEAVGTHDYYDKMTFSCWDDETIQTAIKDTGKKYIIICGIEAHICVLQTCIDLKEAGYIPVLVTDCISSRKASDLKIALNRARDEGVVLTSSEAILFELLRKAGQETFKTISKLIK